MKRLVIGIAAFALVLGACGDDDGGDVRDIDGGTESGTGSGSPSGTGSGSPSGTGSGSASGSATGVAAECVPVGDADAADVTVGVELGEWVIDLSTQEVAAGAVLLEADNVGAEPHELVVIRGVAPGDLPLDEHGALDESGLPDGALIGEIEPFPAGEDCTGVFDLEPGDYTLVCNIVETEEGGEVESHLEEGMVTTLTVT
jgi:hypothetical protein